MVSFEGFEARDDSPIYQQVLDYIKRVAVAGVITDGEELPSRRVVSALLGINPNTVQKAFRLLEEEGLIKSQIGAKSYMTLSPEVIRRLREELLREEILSLKHALQQMAVTKEEAVRLMVRYWDAED